MNRLCLIISGLVLVMNLNFLFAKTSGMQFLRIAVGPRAIALGEAFVGLSDDVSAIYWNPAGLSQLNKKEFCFMHNEWLVDFRSEYLAFAMPLRDKEGVGLSLSGIYSENNRLDESGNKIGKFWTYDAVLTAAYSKVINPSISIGLSIKFIYSVIDDENATAGAVDLGGLYHTQFVGNPLSLGAVIQNLGPETKFVNESFPLPITLKLGANYRMFQNRLNILLDIDQPFYDKPKLHFGAEYWLLKIIGLRAGYTYNINDTKLGGLSNAAIGIGLKIDDYQMDYAITSFGELGISHRAGFILRF